MEGIDQPADGIHRILFGGVGQMGVANRGSGTAVAEERLDMAKAEPLFQKMGCKGVPQ